MCCVCTHVSTLMVTMYREVTSDALLDLELLVSEHVSIVTSPVKTIIGLDEIVVVIFVSVDARSKAWDLSQ